MRTVLYSATIIKRLARLIETLDENIADVLSRKRFENFQKISEKFLKIFKKFESREPGILFAKHSFCE